MYVKPEVEVIEFEFEGIIASSGDTTEGSFGMDDMPSDPGRPSIWD